MASPLATVVGELLAMIPVPHHSDPLSPKQHHLFQPAGAIKTQPRQDGGKAGRNMTPLVGPNSTTGPIYQHQVVNEGALFPKSTIKPQLPQPQVTVTLGAF